MGSGCTKNTEVDEDLRRAECAAYVRRALEQKVIIEDEVPDFSECLCEIPSEEVILQYDNQLNPAPDSTPHTSAEHVQPSTEELADLNLEGRTCVWRLGHKYEFDYKLPYDNNGEAKEYTIDVFNSKKRLIYALGDLHIGGTWSNGMESKLEAYLNKIMAKANDEVAAVVLLGDVIEMWLEKYHEVPPSNEERVKQWKESTHLQMLVDAVIKLVDVYNVKVFYVRGNHDQELTANGDEIEDLFDGRATFIPSTVILRLKVSEKEELTVRFSHGHEWDVFNSYMSYNTNKLISNLPLGYFVSRAVATSGGTEGASDMEKLLIDLAQLLLNAIPSSLEDNLVSVLSSPETQRILLERLFEGAFKVNNLDFLMKAKCRLSEDHHIRLETLLNYPLFQLHSSVVGEKDVFHMLKAATGDYEEFLRRSDEDVVVLAHTHSWDLKHYINHKGNLITYANTGCWTRHSDEAHSYSQAPQRHPLTRPYSLQGYVFCSNIRSTNTIADWKHFNRFWKELKNVKAMTDRAISLVKGTENGNRCKNKRPLTFRT